MKKIFTFITLLFLPVTMVYGQTFALNIEAPPELTVTVLTDGNLDYGTVLQDQQYTINLMDSRTEVISIKGNKDRDIYVSITSQNLILDASNIIPYTLKASYANEGEEDKTQAQDNSITNGSASFPIYDDRGGGPPPWAGGGNNGGGQPTAKAYLYIYGDIEVGNNRAGTYTGTININVEYD